MAETIGVDSGLPALVTFACASSASLFQTIDGFNSNLRIIRELRDELKALHEVLQALQKSTASYGDLKELELPLLRCGKACRELENEIITSIALSGGAGASFRILVELKHRGDDIAGFKNMLDAYRSTFTIALANIKLRNTTVNSKVYAEHKQLIRNTISDLEERQVLIESRLQALPVQGASRQDEQEREQYQEELESVKQCLAISTDASKSAKKFTRSTSPALTSRIKSLFQHSEALAPREESLSPEPTQES